MSFEKKFTIITITATLIIMLGGAFYMGSSSTPTVSASQNAKATVSETSSDWGDIPMLKGNVTKVFTIENTGTDILKLFNVKTSCHCTKARVSINSNESPDFGMNGLSSWIGEIAPGKKATLSVIFDPAYHGPNGVGPINRYVSVETNDKSNPKITFTVTGTVFK